MEDLYVSHLTLNICYFNNINNISKWNYGLVKACHGANYMIEKGANNWNRGLYGTCQGGKRELAELMIEKGADDWNRGLDGACLGGHIDLANYMIEKGATNGHLIDEYFQS